MSHDPQHAVWQAYPAWKDLAPVAGSFDCAHLNALKQRLVPDLGLDFVEQEILGARRRQALRKSGQKVPYEEEILKRGGIPTRPGHPHDLFNALVWLTFPCAKKTLHELAYRLSSAEPAEPGRRGPARDRLTALDEGGLLLVVPQGLEGAARELVKATGEERKMAGLSSLRHAIFVFGHGLLEVVTKDPAARITAMTMVLAVEEAFFSLVLSDQLRVLDERLCAVLSEEGFAAERSGSLPTWHLLSSTVKS